MNAIIAPSLLSADFTNLGKEIEALQNAGIDWLHLDIMDGSFVPNITFGIPVIKALRKCSHLFFDAHLMIDDPGRYIEDFANAGANLIVPHAEAMLHGPRVLEQIHACGAKAGVALNPGTDLSVLRWLLPYLDLVMIMGVNPGFSGQKFIKCTFEKISDCRKYLNDLGYGHIPIEIDGGACLQNAGPLMLAGADVIVSGSAFFKIQDYALALRQFNDAMDKNFIEERKSLSEVLSWHAK